MPSSFGHLDVHQDDVGVEAPGRFDRLFAVGGLTANLKVVLGLEDQSEAGSNHRLVVRQNDTDSLRRSVEGEGRVDGEAALRAGPGAQMAAVEADALAHADQPMPTSVRLCGGGAGAAVVDHLDFEGRPSVVQPNGCSAPAGVLERVGERLLNDAIGGDLKGCRQRTLVPVDDEFDLEPALSRLPDEVWQLREVGLRGEVVRLVGTAEKAEQSVQLKHCLAAGVLDRTQHHHCLLRTPPHHAPCGAGLNAHDADVVGDDVVQFTRDAYPLFEHRASCVFVSLAL